MDGPHRIGDFSNAVKKTCGRRRTHARQELNDSKAGNAITRVLDPTQKCQDILDMRGFQAVLQVLTNAVKPLCEARSPPKRRSQSSLNSLHGSTFRPFAMRAILSIEIFRSDRSTALRYVRLIPHSCARASWLRPRAARSRRMFFAKTSRRGPLCVLFTDAISAD